MHKGTFVDDTPLVKVVVGWGDAAQTPFAILDTGFSGDMQVTPDIASELGLEVIGVTKIRTAGGGILDVPVAQAASAMEGLSNYVEVLISEGMPLIGISFLSKFNYKAVVDCKNKTVALVRV